MLFGHQNDNAAQSAPPPPPLPVDDAATAPAVNPLAVDPDTGVGLPATEEDQSSPLHFAPAQTDEPTPLEPAPSAPEVTDEAPISTQEPVVSRDLPDDHDEDVAHEEPAAAVSDVPHDDLLAIKQQALAQLSPLVGQLEQTPEEKFRTTMMLLQSTDNAALINDAYAAAQDIPDEKARAQALLDVVNEINYFTQQK